MKRMRTRGSRTKRYQALALLDQMLAKSRNRKTLMAALETEFNRDPAQFFRRVIMPLLPREALSSPDVDPVIEWRPLLPEGPTQGEVQP